MVMYRNAQPGDRRGLAECFCELQEFERTLEPNRADARKICREYIRGLFDDCAQHNGVVFVAESEGRIIGFVCVLGRMRSEEIIEADRDYAYVTDLIVRAECRRTGIGAQLMAAAEAHAVKCGARRLKVGVLAANMRAHRVYRRLGFRDNEVVLEKRIGGQS